MDKSVIFDTRQLIWSNPDIPHYGTGLVCFRSNYASRTYPAGIDYFNRELTLIFILRGRSEVKINGQDVTLSAGSVLFHGANYLTRHLYSSDDIDFITLYLSKEFAMSDVYLNQTIDLLLASLRKNRQYAVCLLPDEKECLKKELDDLMALLRGGHTFQQRRLLVQCHAVFLDVAHWMADKVVMRSRLSKREDLLQRFHLLATARFKEEHQVGYYALELSVSKQYLSRIVREATGMSVSEILEELLAMEACAQLLTPGLPVSEIADSLRFSDTANFCRFFKRVMKETPLEYRKHRLKPPK